MTPSECGAWGIGSRAQCLLCKRLCKKVTTKPCEHFQAPIIRYEIPGTRRYTRALRGLREKGEKNV